MCAGQDTAVNRTSHCCRTGENTVVDTLIEVKAKAVISTSPHVEPKIVTDTLLEIQPKTLTMKLGDVMTEALIDALPSPVNFSERLYEKKDNPFTGAKS